MTLTHASPLCRTCEIAVAPHSNALRHINPRFAKPAMVATSTAALPWHCLPETQCHPNKTY